MIEVGNLSHGFRGRTVLDDVSLRIGTGERVALSGRSGCGKSTFLALLAGLVAPDGGTIHLDGKRASSPRCVELPPHRRGIGFVFQSPALWPHMSVEQNVLFGLAGLPGRERTRRLDQVLEATGCTALARRRPDTLSGGEQRRVALARALAPAPGILLLDEPLSNLDTWARDDLAGLISATARASRATVVYVSHDPAEARDLCTRFLTLEAGRISEQDLAS